MCLGLCLFLVGLAAASSHPAALPAQDWLALNLQRLQVKQPQDFSFAVLGDGRDNLPVFSALLRQLNQDPQLAFALEIGDLVHTGEVQEYRQFFEVLQNHNRLPFLTALGNHELGNHGRGLYYEIFGPYYYSFTVGRNYFLVLDDANGKGLDLWQRQWLEEELKKARDYQTRLVFFHVPLFDPRGGPHHYCLPPAAAEELAELFAKYRVSHIFTAHLHGYFTGHWRGIPFTLTGGAGAPLAGQDPEHYFYHYLKVRLHQGEIEVQVQKVVSVLRAD
jgi:hypothetical protein